LDSIDKPKGCTEFSIDVRLKTLAKRLHIVYARWHAKENHNKGPCRNYAGWHIKCLDKWLLRSQKAAEKLCLMAHKRSAVGLFRSHEVVIIYAR